MDLNDKNVSFPLPLFPSYPSSSSSASSSSTSTSLLFFFYLESLRTMLLLSVGGA